jgi:DNA-binding MarR family transcriptional regulator
VDRRAPQLRRRAADKPVVNAKRVHRIMGNHAMLLEKHTAVRKGRVHDGKVMVMRSNLRWCADDGNNRDDQDKLGVQQVVKQKASRELKLARLARALTILVRRAEEALEAAAREGRIHPTDLRCIGFLMQVEAPVSPKEITSFLGLTSGAGTALLDRLEKAGYIARVRNPEDRRSVLIMVDEKGAEQQMRLLRQLRAEYSAVTEKYSDAELDTIADYLEGVSALRPSSKGPANPLGEVMDEES